MAWLERNCGDVRLGSWGSEGERGEKGEEEDVELDVHRGCFLGWERGELSWDETDVLSEWIGVPDAEACSGKSVRLEQVGGCKGVFGHEKRIPICIRSPLSPPLHLPSLTVLMLLHSI